jgi:hypothetical protein
MASTLNSIPEPAIYVCRFPVPQPRPFRASIAVPFVAPPAWAPGALAQERLALPQRFHGVEYPLLPDDVDAGTVPLWAEPSDSPLLLPADVILRRRAASEWGASTFITLEDLGEAIPTEVVAAVAWWVLARVDRVAVLAWLAELALVVEVAGRDRAAMEAIATTVGLPSMLAGHLVAHVRSGRPLFHPRAVLWILRELAAADPEELAGRASWRPLASCSSSYDPSVTAHSLFPGVARGGAPDDADLARAVWLLQQGFHGFDIADDDLPDRLASMSAALGFRFTLNNRWSTALDQWFQMWRVPDSHPNTVGAGVPPSAARARFEETVGVPPHEWLAGIWALCMRWTMSALPGIRHTVTGDPDLLFELPLGSDQNRFHDTFIDAFRQHCTTSLEAFGAECRRHAVGGYRGLGNLPQSDSLATRNNPVLEFPDGRLLPLSVELVADRALDIYRLRGGVQAAGQAYGPMFEAYVTDLLGRLEHRVRLVGESELEAATPPGHQRADALVVDGRDYLAIEISLQTMSRKVASGDVQAVRKMAERYQDEADQAIATLDDLWTLRTQLGTPAPHVTAFLVVTDEAVTHSPAFLQILAAVRRGRPTKFLCTAADLDHLVRLAERGWSIAAAVATWQSSPENIALGTHLHRMTEIHSITGTNAISMEEWIAHLPQQRPSAPTADRGSGPDRPT